MRKSRGGVFRHSHTDNTTGIAHPTTLAGNSARHTAGDSKLESHAGKNKIHSATLTANSALINASNRGATSFRPYPSVSQTGQRHRSFRRLARSTSQHAHQAN